MISEEDEPSSVLNGRLRPRKSTATTPNPPIKSYFKPEYKIAQDKPKRNNTPSKATPNKQDDLTAKADSSPLAQFLCPYCDRKFTSKISASKHTINIHPCTSKQDNFFNCLFCYYSDATADDIIRHMVDNHPKQYVACLECNSRFVSNADLEQHKLNVCKKQKQSYRSKLRKKASTLSKKDQKKVNVEDKNPGEIKELEHEFNNVVISCELKPSQVHEPVDVEDKITTNLILPSNISNTGLENNAVIILDDIQWNRRIPPNFSFRNADADQILSRLGVVHRSPRAGESTRREWLKLIDDNSQKFEKCFDTNFYSRVASNVQENLARFLDGSFNFSPDPDKIIKTRKSKSSAIINTAEGFPILLPQEQYSRNRFEGYMPRAIAPKHKWKWDSTENDKNIIIDANVIKRDNHVDNCIITLVSSLDIWTQLRMRRKFEGVFCKTPTEKIEKQNIIGRQLKEILESREIPRSKLQIVAHTSSSAPAPAPAPAPALAPAPAPAPAPAKDAFDFPSFLGLSARVSDNANSLQPVPAVLSGEWVRPRCYVCCACGDQTRDSRALTAHMASHHPNAQVQHYEIVGESLLNADILKHLYVPPSQMSNRTRPLRGFRDCTKCKKSIALEELHQHMLDCAGDTPTVRRKCRSRPFGVRKRRPRLPDNAIRKKIRKDLRTRHNQKSVMRPRPRIRTEVGDAETIRKMLADLPAKRHRSAEEHTNQQVLRPRRKLDKQRNKLKIKRLKDTKTRKVQIQKDTNDSSTIDEDDQPLKPKTKTKHTVPAKKRFSSRVLASKNKKRSSAAKEVPVLNEHQQDAPTGDANASQPNLNGNSIEKNIGEGENHDRPENNDQREPAEDCAAPDHTLLNNFTNNITALQLQQQHLPQKTNTEDTLRDTNNVILQNEEVFSIPVKPLQRNQKSSSEKKRQSLLNCIEKIKSQQKGETMGIHSASPKKNRKASEPTHLSLLTNDPHPAVISCTRDESGAAKNVVPDKIFGPHTNKVNVLYPKKKYKLHSELEIQRQLNEIRMIAPIPTYSQLNDESLFASTRAQMAFGIQRHKSSAARASIAQSYHPCYRMWHASQMNTIQHIETMYGGLHRPDGISFLNTNLLMQPPTVDVAHNNYPVQYHGFPITGQYDTSDIHYGDRRDHVIDVHGRNETSQYPYITSLSPQPWSRESSQTPLVNNNHTVRSMLSMSANEPVIQTPGQIAQKRVSESSENDLHSNPLGLGDANFMLNYAFLRRGSIETTANVYAPLTNQGNTESPHYYNSPKRPNPQKDISCYKPYDSTSYTQDGNGRTNDNESAFREVTTIRDEHYYTEPSQTTATEYQNNVPPMAVKESHSIIPRSGNTVDDLKTNEYLVSLYSRNLIENKIHERFSAEHPHLSPSVPTETQAAKLTPSLNDSIIQKTIDTPDHNGDNIQNSLNRKKQSLCTEVSNYQETSKNQIDSGPNEESFNLSGINRQPICNDERAFGVTHMHSVLTTRPQYYAQTAQSAPVRDIGSAFEHNETNEDVPIDLSFKNNSRPTHNKPNETPHKKQDMVCTIEQNNVEMARAFESKLQASDRSAILSNRLEKLSPSCLNTTSAYPEQSIFQKDAHVVDITNVQNQMIESNFADEKISSNDNNPYTTISSIDHDPEAANATVNLPESVLQKQRIDFSDKASQMPETEEPLELLVTDQIRAKVTQNVENSLIDANTATVCDALSNYSKNIRLTINTAILPSSSILPKKRHSPSSGLSSQDAYSNITLSKQQPPSKITSIINRNHLSNAPGENSYETNNKRIDKIIDLTDDGLNLSKIILNSNVLPLQESIPKPQNISKNFNEKTASLRAVRFKAPLARKSISDEKQPISKVYNQQLTCLDLSQKDRQIEQTNLNFECDTINLTVDNTTENAEYNANISTTEVKTGTTRENFVQIESETSMATLEQRDQFEVGAYNDMLAMPCLDILPAKTMETKIVGRKNTESDTLLLTSKSTIDVEYDSIKITNIISDPMALSDSFNLTRPEIYDRVENNPKDTKNRTGIYIDSHVNATKQILESNENNNANATFKPVTTILQDNTIKHMLSITKLNEDEDSDDDISLALIVKQKHLEQASDPVIDANEYNIPKHTTTEKTCNKVSEMDLDLLAIKANTLNTVTEDEPLISAMKFDKARKSNSLKSHTINSMLDLENEDKSLIEALMVDEAIKTNRHAIKSDNTAKPVENLTVKASYINDVDKENLTEMKQDLEPNDLANNKAERHNNGTSENSSNNEDTYENSLIDDAELTHASNEKSDDSIVFQINAKKYIDMDCEANELLWKNNNQSKSIHGNTQIYTVVQNNSNETEKNEIQSTSYINQKANSNQPSKSDDGNVSSVLENTKNIDKLNTPAELQPLSPDADTMNTNKEGAQKYNSSETDFNAITDSELTSDIKETNKKALRRSKRGKSMFSGSKDSNNDDTIEVNHTNVQKKPVTVKQLIFSKLLRNDNLQSEKNITLASISAENVADIKSAPALKIAAKRKTSPNKTKSKKAKSHDYECSDLDNWNCTPENSKHLQQSHDTIDDNGSDTEVSGLSREKSNNNSEVKTDNPDYNENKIIKPEKTNTCVEIRTACYNRPIGNDETSTSIPMTKPKDYDPYIFNLDADTAETTRPIMKRKSNKTVSVNNSNKSSKKILRNGDEPVDIIRQEPELANRKLTVTTPPTVSDSDSSISDAPLQKYVEDKEKLNGENLKSSDCNKLRETSKERFDGEIDSTSEIAHLTSNDEEASGSKVEISERKMHLTNSTDDNTQRNVIDIKDITSQRNHDTANQTTSFDVIEDVVDISTVKSDEKQEPNPGSIISIRTESVAIPEIENETERQLSPDKFMENFGFYITKQPRLCNIIALKKIAETFQNFKHDEASHGTKDKKKSSHVENKKTTVAARTSKVTQDANNANSERKCRTNLQSSQPQDTSGTNMIDKQDTADDVGELDVIMAQKMLETEDIRKLERELYSELKRAAVANAGKTSGLNHLRAEETNMHDNNIHDVGNDTEMKTIKTPENPESIESPERCLSPEMPESPESLIKDKPLMYPEEEVNIYEDKYDIIKRRREATANAKQVPKIDKPRKSKVAKRPKKPERKYIKKIKKKHIYQGSQVPTKGALKGFDGIKISIPTQDLNMPPNVSPPHHQQRQGRTRKRKDTFGNANPGSSYISDSDTYSKEVVTSDIYEFKDDERPVTEGYRLLKVNDISKSSSSGTDEDFKITTRKEKFYKKGKHHEIEGAKIRKSEGKGKGKGKRTNADKDTNKETHVKHKKNKKEKQIKEKEPEISIIDGSKAENIIDDCEQPVKTIVEDDDGLSNDSTNNLGTLQDNVEPFEESDTEMQTAMPGTLGFVPDRNDESSYESDSSSRTPLLSVLKGPYVCTCLSEIDSDDSETERGCAHRLCRYSHLNAAKNAVMGKIFKSNAVRCDKPDESLDESPKPKPDLDRLFDSLLEPNTNNNTSETRTSPVPGPSSATSFHLTTHSQTQTNESFHDKEVSFGQDGFSSPNYHDSDKNPKKVFHASRASSNDINSSIEDDATYIFGGKTDKPIHNLKNIMLKHKLVQTDVTRLLATADDLQVGRNLEIGKEPELLSKTHPYTYGRTSNHNLDMQEPCDHTLSTRGTQTKRSFPQSDIETSSCEGDLNASKITKRNRRQFKKHKSHHKRYKVYQHKEFDEANDDSKATASKQNSRSKIAIGENKKESIKKRSNGHDDSTDTYVMELDTGVAVQRARRKCTVGKQNVLAEHWSSSESEADSAPNRAKGRKSSVSKRISRTGKKERGSKRSRGAESDDGETSGTRAPAEPSARARAASAVVDRDRDSGSDDERDVKQEQHGWIVGHSHKKLVTMLACCKSKPRLEVKEKEKKK